MCGLSGLFVQGRRRQRRAKNEVVCLHKECDNRSESAAYQYGVGPGGTHSDECLKIQRGNALYDVLVVRGCYRKLSYLIRPIDSSIG